MSRVQAVHLFVYLGLREAPLGPAAVRGFRLEAVVNRTQSLFVSTWDHVGHTIIDHVGSEDLLVAMAAYEAARKEGLA